MKSDIFVSKIPGTNVNGEVPPDDWTFCGNLDDALKWNLHARADLFVLPTHVENIGIVIAEALASETPVITTKGAPWADLELHGCGWWIGIGPESLAVALQKATSCSNSELKEMGTRGRVLIGTKYAWSLVATQMKQVYTWVIEGGVPPNFIVQI